MHEGLIENKAFVVVDCDGILDFELQADVAPQTITSSILSYPSATHQDIFSSWD